MMGHQALGQVGDSFHQLAQEINGGQETPHTALVGQLDGVDGGVEQRGEEQRQNGEEEEAGVTDTTTQGQMCLWKNTLSEF